MAFLLNKMKEQIPFMNKRFPPFLRGLAAAIALGSFSASTNAQGITNGSFEAQPAGTTRSIGSSAGGANDTTTFTGWRVFSVGSPSVSNFTATIITNHTDGNLALRLSLTNTGGGTGLDHGLDNFNAMVPVTFGRSYNLSFDAAHLSGATNLGFSVTEFNAANGYTAITDTYLVVADANYQTYSFQWTPLTNTTTKVVLAFRQINSGALTYSVMSFDNMRFTAPEVFLDPLFTDDMVVQREAPVRIYGSGIIAGASVTVAFGGQTKTTTVSNGVWEVWLDPMPANPQGQTLTINGAATLARQNILVGDVWVLGGQSNMQAGISEFPTLWPMMQAANQPLIRVSYVNWPAQSPQQSGIPQALLETPTLRHSKWYPCVYPGAAAEAQALLNEYSPGGYFFATNLVGHTQVPVGLIMACLGATKAQAWTPLSTLTQYPELQLYLQQNDPNTSYLYNSVINPIRKFSVRGVLWYQGESDNDLPEEYGLLFPRLIQSWREAWGKELPFIFASLSSFAWPSDSWAYLRESQAKGLSQTNTGMIMTYDLGDYANIHPENKREVGSRFYLKARAVAYGENLISSGPVYQQVTITGGQATVTFTNVGSGLGTRDVSMPKNAARTEFYTVSSNTLAGFTMCGPDLIFYPAVALISGTNSVSVQSASVTNPVAVRYAWATFALANLFNREGFPAEPFRTDTFPRPPFVINGSFEAQPAGTTKSIGSSAGGEIDNFTFTGWRVASVGSPSVANFTATIITNHTDGNLAMRLSLTNTGGAGGLDHGMDNYNDMVPVTFGQRYTLSFDAAHLSGATSLNFSVTEFNAANGYTAITVTNLVVASANYQTYTFRWTPLTNTTKKVVLAFRQQNSGALTYSVMSFDNVRFTQSVPSRLSAISVTGTTATIAYWGTPGDSYVIQRSTNLIAWVAIRTNTVPGSGAVTNSDTFSDLGPPPYPRSAYYRLQTH